MFDREPVINASTAAAGASVLLALLLAFGVDVSKEQTTAILGVVGFAAPILAAVFARKRVTPSADPRDSAGHELVPVRDLDV